MFLCFSDGGSDLFSPEKTLEPCSEDGSSDVDGELNGVSLIYCTVHNNL